MLGIDEQGKAFVTGNYLLKRDLGSQVEGAVDLWVLSSASHAGRVL
jgi:hypothetical protein